MKLPLAPAIFFLLSSAGCLPVAHETSLIGSFWDGKSQATVPAPIDATYMLRNADRPNVDLWRVELHKGDLVGFRESAGYLVAVTPSQEMPLPLSIRESERLDRQLLTSQYVWYRPTTCKEQSDERTLKILLIPFWLFMIPM